MPAGEILTNVRRNQTQALKAIKTLNQVFLYSSVKKIVFYSHVLHKTVLENKIEHQCKKDFCHGNPIFSIRLSHTSQLPYFVQVLLHKVHGLWRGDNMAPKVNTSGASIKAQSPSQCVDWCPAGFKVGIDSKPPTAPSDGNPAKLLRAF